ncbi:MAG: hypothetical protein IPL51_08090 [Candidatus Competibacteraceae bacterium]|nr:hypothetical protein [Candidatus Competibacteraceae bacterium]
MTAATPTCVDAPDLQRLSPEQRDAMRAAGRELRECQRVLEKAGLNVVGELLKGQGDFVELEHYPRDDVFDAETHGQYYYHAHRGGELEHGHFHTFLRADGMPEGVAPLDDPQASEPWPQGDEALCHLVAVAMDAWGDPIGLFCVNRWVTDETWTPAEAVIAMLDRFAIDHAFPNWAVNRWLTALLRLYRPHIEALIRHRDQVIAAWRRTYPDRDALEDRALEITGYLPIKFDALLAQLASE